jgi:hypothetical protein
MNEEQKLRLLDNSERLERTGRHLTTGYRIILETEEIGSQVLQDLHAQHETIQKSRSRVRVFFYSCVAEVKLPLFIYCCVIHHRLGSG